MRHRIPLPLFALALSSGVAAQANPAPSGEPAEIAAPQDDAIIVTGSKELKKTVHRYIRSVIVPEAAGQYARFDAPACPSAIGVSRSLERAIEARIRAVAKASGVEVGEDGCKPNLHVMIVNDGSSAIASLRQRHKRAFGKMQPYLRGRLERGEGPVYHWHVVFPLSSDHNMNRATPGSFGGGDETFGLINDDAMNAARTSVKSRIQLPVRQTINHAFVLIERQSVIGLTPVQIADFAAMRSLVRASQTNETPGGIKTILDLFSDELVRRDQPVLSQWDLALLKSLYAARPDMDANRQREQMARVFVKVLDGSE